MHIRSFFANVTPPANPSCLELAYVHSHAGRRIVYSPFRNPSGIPQNSLIYPPIDGGNSCECHAKRPLSRELGMYTTFNFFYKFEFDDIRIPMQPIRISTSCLTAKRSRTRSVIVRSYLPFSCSLYRLDV